MGYLDILKGYGLKSVILSGGGNPILYKRDGKNFNDVVGAIHERGLEIGLITNGMPLEKQIFSSSKGWDDTIRNTWKNIFPGTLDKLTWIRVSMAGLDHDEREVYVPDIDPEKTTLGFSYVGHDIYKEPGDLKHGKVSRPSDIISGDIDREPDQYFEERIEELRDQFTNYCEKYQPRYLRLLPNCLEPPLIDRRCEQLNNIADVVNHRLRRNVVFVQYKPPKAPHVCLLGSVHPVLNADGFCYPCDSVVLNESAGHKFGETWRICHWSEIKKLYDKPLPNSLIIDTQKQCPGCVFTKSNEILEGVRDGTIDYTPSVDKPEHINFI
jgi:hypothetical protein